MGGRFPVESQCSQFALPHRKSSASILARCSNRPNGALAQKRSFAIVHTNRCFSC
jgi:hypothetical protein